MRFALCSVSLCLVLAAAGCGGGNDVANLITSTPDAASLQVAETNVQAANTSLQSYLAENGSYAGATAATLRQLDAGLSSTVTVTATAAAYCIESTVDGVTASLSGPGSGTPQPGPCS